jgi:protein-S-isoprenylcysteine O-methyltransferase Ste14
MTSVYDSSAPGIRLPPPLLYLAAFACGLLGELAAPSPGLPGWLRIGGAVTGIVLLGLLDTRAMLRFRRHRTPFNPARPAEALVTDGPYRFTRNPMYIGMACAYGGAAVGVGALWSLALLPAVLFVIDRAIIPKEERHLHERFAQDYERYRLRVPRWLWR